MPARLNHNVNLKQVHHNMRIHFDNTGSQIEKAASGRRINRSSDDPAGLALADGIKSEIMALTEGSRNVQQSIQMLQVAEGALGQISAIVQRLQGLSAQSASSTYTDADRPGINSEFQALKNEIERIAEVTSYNRIKLLDSVREFTIQVGPAGDSNDVSRIVIGDMRTSGPTLNIDLVAIDTALNARNALDQLQEVELKVLDERNRIAAFQNRLQLSATTTANIVEKMQSSESDIRDADMAQTLSNLSRSQIMAQTASSLAQEADIDIERILTLMQ
ncbi:MAG: flagellin [Candidatus Latescibacterota bacterium]|nr:flagellin [Candidatus Latescibacterota bacterium]